MSNLEKNTHIKPEIGLNNSNKIFEKIIKNPNKNLRASFLKNSKTRELEIDIIDNKPGLSFYCYEKDNFYNKDNNKNLK